MEEQLITHPFKGALFESFVIAEIIKRSYNQGIKPHHYFWAVQSGVEMDCLIEKDDDLIPVEIKSSQTIHSKFFGGLAYWSKLTSKDRSRGYLVYGGKER